MKQNRIIRTFNQNKNSNGRNANSRWRRMRCFLNETMLNAMWAMQMVRSAIPLASSFGAVLKRIFVVCLIGMLFAGEFQMREWEEGESQIKSIKSSLQSGIFRRKNSCDQIISQLLRLTLSAKFQRGYSILTDTIVGRKTWHYVQKPIQDITNYVKLLTKHWIRFKF